MNHVFKGVIFDLDGVLTDTAEYHYQAWKRLAEKLGIYFDRKINERLKGVSRRDSLDVILENSTKTYTLEEKVKLTDEKNTDYVALIQNMTAEELLPGGKELLKFLKQEGYKIALASASKNAFTVIKNLDIEDYFDYIVDVAKVKKGKPDPEIFLTAAMEIGLDPKFCIGVEDAQAGIQAINQAGMFAVGVGDKDSLKGADVVIQNLNDFQLEEYESKVMF